MDTTTLGFRGYFPFSVPLWERTAVTGRALSTRRGGPRGQEALLRLTIGKERGRMLRYMIFKNRIIK